MAWQSEDGADNAGVVTFHGLGEGQARVTVQIAPTQRADRVGRRGSRPAQGRVKGDLERFKQFIESRGGETGAWRGEVEQDPAT